MIFFDVIASGSKGNATLVFAKENIFLIDFGITNALLESSLAKYNKKISDIDGLFVTHEHADHIRSLKAISPKKQYALEGTLPSSLSNVLSLNEAVEIKGVKITPFLTSHDACNPCGYMIDDGEERLVYMTDTGKYLSRNTPLLKNPDYLIIESNHDIQMLLRTNRPMVLKERIMSDHGHLCNEDSAFAALEIIGDKTKEVILAHLSEEANTPELALEAYRKVFQYAHQDFEKYHIRCANQWTNLVGGHYEH